MKIIIGLAVLVALLVVGFATLAHALPKQTVCPSGYVLTAPRTCYDGAGRWVRPS
jgi:hypothetical protein